MERIDEIKVQLFDLSKRQNDLSREFAAINEQKKPLLKELAELEKAKEGEK